MNLIEIPCGYEIQSARSIYLRSDRLQVKPATRSCTTRDEKSQLTHWEPQDPLAPDQELLRASSNHFFRTPRAISHPLTPLRRVAGASVRTRQSARAPPATADRHPGAHRRKGRSAQDAKTHSSGISSAAEAKSSALSAADSAASQRLAQSLS